MHSKICNNVILAVTNDLATDQRVNKIATTLCNSGFNVTVIGRKLNQSPGLSDKPYIQQRMRLLFNSGFAFYAEYNFRLFLKLLFSKVDIITANDLDTLLACYLVSKLRNKKLVYDSHEYFTEVPELLNNKTAKLFWTKLEEFIFPKLSKVSTVCQSIADIYTQKYKVKVKVVRNLPFYKNTNCNEKPKNNFGTQKLIIYQGAVNIGRGIENMINAMLYIENTTFLIIGSGDKEQELRQLVKNIGLSNKVIFTGKLHYDELYHYTLQADLGMSLEQNMGLNYYYALPNKLFDYIQASTPVIASDLPEIKRIIETYEVGFVSQALNPKQLADEIIKFFENHEFQEHIKQNQKKAAKELCWEKESDVLLSLYC